RVSQTPNGVAADWAGRSSPLFERFLRARDRRLVIVISSGSNAGQPPAIDRRYLVDLRAAATPFTREDAWIFLAQPELLEGCFHMFVQLRARLMLSCPSPFVRERGW